MARRWAVVAVGLVGCSAFKTQAPPEPVARMSAPPGPPAQDAGGSASPPPRGGDVSLSSPLTRSPARTAGESPGPHASPPPHGGGGETPAPRAGVSGGGAPPPPPGPEPADTLTLAAEALGRGDRAAAATHLEDYVRGRPEQLMFRAQLAELLVGLGRDDAARVHFERFAAAARHSTGLPREHLVHAHTRLVEIAQRDGDRFAEALHRGAGLLLLAREQDGDPERDEGFCEEILCKALKSLREARELKPHDPQVRAWLAEAYDRTGNRRAADAERAGAGAATLREYPAGPRP